MPFLTALACGLLALGFAAFFGSVFLLILAAPLLVLAGVLWRFIKVGYILGTILSALFLVLFAPNIISGLTQFADFGLWLLTMVLAPGLVILLMYSVLGIKLAWRKGAPTTSGRVVTMSSILAFLAVGFIVGGVTIGALANGQILGVVHSSNARAEIVIAPGASNGIPQPYFPANFTTKVGSVVTWLNNDTVTHTVTSVSVPSGANSFDSGNLNYGLKFSVTLTVPGTYTYYCAIHPSMKGTITVTT